MASCFQAFSSDVSPHLHKLCPQGGSIRGASVTASAKGETPPSHSVKKPFLSSVPEAKQKEIMNIYEDHTKTDLQKCLMERTQNPNECPHAQMWTKSTNSKFAGPSRMKFVCGVTLLEHNFGYVAGSLLTHLEFGASLHTLAGPQIKKNQGLQRRQASK